MRKKIVERVSITLCLLAMLNNSYSGTLTVTTSPTYTTAADKTKYIAISKYDASSSGTGVTFGSSNTTTNGSVTGWKWTFQNGSIGGTNTSTIENPGKVTFGTPAYGLSNSCTVGVNHSGSGTPTENCANSSDTVVTVKVNVIKPILEFRTSGSWSSDNTCYTAAQTDYGVSLTIGSKVDITIGGFARVGVPYEYKYTIEPANSGAVSAKMDIYEAGYIGAQDYYRGETLHDSDDPLSTEYNKYKNGYHNYTSVTAPANPIMFATDVPAVTKLYYEGRMQELACNKAVIAIVLTSYPTYDDPTPSHLDSASVKSHVFHYTCTSSNSNGTGTYTWTATP